ncbi:MAG: toxin ParE1 [Nitrospirales bacterium]|nr:MAG: toxin ParE1 [Nitrospirales bacterium]
MARYQLSVRAQSDLDEIADYTINTFGIEQARRYRDSLETCFQTLAESPLLGRSAAQLSPDLRRYEIQLHVVFYILTETGVLIVRVLHERRDASKQINPSSEHK